MGIVPDVGMDAISGLISDALPATIMAAARRDMEPGERDAERAKMVRERLGG